MDSHSEFGAGGRPVLLMKPGRAVSCYIHNYPVIASKAKQSRLSHTTNRWDGWAPDAPRPLDCFVARAPRNDGEQ